VPGVSEETRSLENFKKNLPAHFKILSEIFVFLRPTEARL
jgi:hypothetical protein